MNVVNIHKSPQDSDKFIEKTNDDVNEWMDGFYVDGRSAPFNLHCLWAWQEQERRHLDIEAVLLEALEAMCKEFRDHDLPYGSSAYANAISVINKARGGA